MIWSLHRLSCCRANRRIIPFAAAGPGLFGISPRFAKNSLIKDINFAILVSVYVKQSALQHANVTEAGHTAGLPVYT